MNMNNLKEFVKENLGKEVVIYNVFGECVEGYFSPVIFDGEGEYFKLLCPAFLGDIPYYVDLYDVERVVLKGSDFSSKVSGNIQKFKITNPYHLEAILDSTFGKCVTIEFLDKNNKQLQYGKIERIIDDVIMVPRFDITSRSMVWMPVNAEDIGFVTVFDINAIFNGNGLIVGD